MSSDQQTNLSIGLFAQFSSAQAIGLFAQLSSAQGIGLFAQFSSARGNYSTRDRSDSSQVLVQNKNSVPLERPRTRHPVSEV